MFYVHHSAGWGWGWWVLMTLGMIAFGALVIYGIVVLVRGGADDGGGRPSPPETPEQILKRRLAAGEISLEEYERLTGAIREEPREEVASSGPR